MRNSTQRPSPQSLQPKRAKQYCLTLSIYLPTRVSETCKLNDVEPLGYLTDILTRIVNGHPNSDIDQLLPWKYGKQHLKAVA